MQLKIASLNSEINAILKFASNEKFIFEQILLPGSKEIIEQIIGAEGFVTVWSKLDIVKDNADIISNNISAYKKKFKGIDPTSDFFKLLDDPKNIESLNSLLNDLIIIKNLANKLNTLIQQGPSANIDIFTTIKTIRDLIIKDVQTGDIPKKINSYFNGYLDVINVLIQSDKGKFKNFKKAIDNEIVLLNTFYKSLAIIAEKSQNILLKFIDPLILSSYFSDPSSGVHTKINPATQFQKAIDEGFSSTFNIAPSSMEYALTVEESKHPVTGKNIRYDRFFHTLPSNAEEWESKKISDYLSPTLLESIELTDKDERKKSNAFNLLMEEKICVEPDDLFNIYNKLRLYSQITGDDKIFIALNNFIRSVNRLQNKEFNRNEKSVDQKYLIEQKEKIKGILRLKINGETLNWLKGHALVLDSSGNLKAIANTSPNSMISHSLLKGFLSAPSVKQASEYLINISNLKLEIDGFFSDI